MLEYNYGTMKYLATIAVFIFVAQASRKDFWDKSYVVLTFALVIIAVFTLRAVWYQAKTTAEAAQATERSVRLQEALNQQRVEVSGWRIGGRTESNPPRFTIFADVSNPTAVPLTIRSVSMKALGESSADYEVENMLASDSDPIGVSWSGEVKPEWLDSYQENMLVLNFSVSVTYVDCFGKEQIQTFLQACFLGPKYFMTSPVRRYSAKSNK